MQPQAERRDVAWVPLKARGPMQAGKSPRAPGRTAASAVGGSRLQPLPLAVEVWGPCARSPHTFPGYSALQTLLPPPPPPPRRPGSPKPAQCAPGSPFDMSRPRGRRDGALCERLTPLPRRRMPELHVPGCRCRAACSQIKQHVWERVRDTADVPTCSPAWGRGLCPQSRGGFWVWRGLPGRETRVLGPRFSHLQTGVVLKGLFSSPALQCHRGVRDGETLENNVRGPRAESLGNRGAQSRLGGLAVAEEKEECSRKGVNSRTTCLHGKVQEEGAQASLSGGPCPR